MALSVPLAMIVLIALPIQLLIYMGFGPFLRRRLRLQFDAGAAHQTQMVENISGIAAVKALSAEQKMLERLDLTLNESLKTGYRVGLLRIWNDKLLLIVDRTITISIIYFGAQMVFAGQITLGELIAFHLVAEKITGPIQNFSRLWESWQNIRVSRQRLGDIVNTPMEPFDKRPNLPNDIMAQLQFHGVDFSYSPGKLVLKQFNFVAKPNTLTLIVGPSGVGKSTFGRLASGIEAPDKGHITIGGCNISEYDPNNVRTNIAYVPQEQRWSHFFDQSAASLRWIRVSFRLPNSLVLFFCHRLHPGPIFRGWNAGARCCSKPTISRSRRGSANPFQMR